MEYKVLELASYSARRLSEEIDRYTKSGFRITHLNDRLMVLERSRHSGTPSTYEVEELMMESDSFEEIEFTSNFTKSKNKSKKAKSLTESNIETWGAPRGGSTSSESKYDEFINGNDILNILYLRRDKVLADLSIGVAMMINHLDSFGMEDLRYLPYLLNYCEFNLNSTDMFDLCNELYSTAYDAINYIGSAFVSTTGGYNQRRPPACDDLVNEIELDFIRDKEQLDLKFNEVEALCCGVGFGAIDYKRFNDLENCDRLTILSQLIVIRHLIYKFTI